MKVGDVVRLKSGGPRMSVDGVPDTVTAKDCVTVHTTWFDAKGDVKWGRFPVDALAKQDA